MPKGTKMSNFYLDVSLKTKTTPLCAERYYKAIIEVITDELKKNGRISLSNFGTFVITEIGGYDMLVPDNLSGERVKKFVATRDRVGFDPSDNYINKINGKLVMPKSKKRKKLGKMREYDYLVEEVEQPELTLDEEIELMLSKKKNKRTK